MKVWRAIEYHWYSKTLTWLTCCLLPLSFIFRLGVRLRRALYACKLLKVYRSKRPVIVVGNLSVGGTGKTPAVIYLAQALQAQGFRPGIILRGYGRKTKGLHFVNASTAVETVGDEAMMLFKRLDCPIVVGERRAEAAARLENETDCNIIISDDGLQHYALARDIEIVIVDGERRLGNGHCLPAGPLREPPARLSEATIIIHNGGVTHPLEYAMQVLPDAFVSLQAAQPERPLNAFFNRHVHAIAGIGNPDRFFNTLIACGCIIHPHPYPDHYDYHAKDLTFEDAPVIMTEKDAVKCLSLAKPYHWYLRVNAIMAPAVMTQILKILQRVV